MPSIQQKVSFNNLDTFLKLAPIIGLAILAYLQTLFPSKEDFSKIHDTMHDVEKQVIILTAMQNTVNQNARNISDIQKAITQIQIDMVKIQNNSSPNP